MKWKADKDKLDEMLRLIRRLKRSRDNNDFVKILNVEDKVIIGEPTYSIAGSRLREICMGMFYFSQPSNTKVYEVLGKCGIEVVDGEHDEPERDES